MKLEIKCSNRKKFIRKMLKKIIQEKYVETNKAQKRVSQESLNQVELKIVSI